MFKKIDEHLNVPHRAYNTHLDAHTRVSLGIKHQKVPHRAYSDDSDAHRFCVSRHHDTVSLLGIKHAAQALGRSLRSML